MKTGSRAGSPPARPSMRLRMRQLPMRRLRLGWTWVVRLMAISLRRHRLAALVGCGAFALATLALFASLGYLAFSRAVPGGGGRPVAATTGDRVELVAFLRDDLPSSSRDELSAVLARLPGVAGVRLLGSEEALARLRSELGDRAAVLDGVEEGFLPATLEVALQAGPNGSDHADALAWRLRRMDGITDVDVLRSVEDGRLARAEAMGRRLGVGGLMLAIMTMVLALGLAALALRRPRGEARLMAGLGFTASAMAAPGAVAGMLCALGGTLIAACLGLLAGRLLTMGWTAVAPIALASDPASAAASGPRWLMGGLVSMVACGAALGWWGARPSTREVDDVVVTR
ncbi:MAG: permease-like cell division protein FtsX [Myxococcales bacterium]